MPPVRQRQSKPFIFDAPGTAIAALQSAGVTVATQANDHAVDCGTQALTQGIALAATAKFPIVGVGNTASQAALRPYRGHR